jgi:hypothetical protein
MVGKKAYSESLLHCFSYALCSAYGDREAAKLIIRTFVGVFQACDSLGLMHREGNHLLPLLLEERK